MNATAATPARIIAARIDALGWGSLFLITGIMLLVPGLPDGSWLVGLGLVLVAVDVARAANGLGWDWLRLIVGGGALLAGLGAIAGAELPVLALVLIACGLTVIVRTLRREAR